MHDLDYTGPNGGVIASAAITAWAAATAFWITVGAVIHRMFLGPRIAELKAENRRLTDRISQLETMLMLHGPSQLRQAMQAALSEQHVETAQSARRSEETNP